VDTAVHRRNLERAHALLEQLENLGHARKWARAIAATLMVRARLYLAEGRITEGSACLNRLERLAAEYAVPTRCAWSEIGDYSLLTRAFLYVAQDRPRDAIAILRALREEGEAVNNLYFALRVATQLSQVLLAADEPGEAANVFHEVLSVAAPAGLYQSILDEGPEIGVLLLGFQDNLRRAGDDRGLLPYVGKLIAGWRELYNPDLAGSPVSSVVSSLSPRERNIIERIGQGRSNKEIARDLGIAPETVKSHVKNIFVKLAVEKRAQAVSRAQSLGLVAT
jgi:LuxR family maltose regulon positive regulatory protein